MVFEYFGTSGIRGYIQQAIDQADWLREQIKATEHFEEPVETKFGLATWLNGSNDGGNGSVS